MSDNHAYVTLTLTQPWASLVALGKKHVETRSWSTNYRGPLAIHAAKGWTEDDRIYAAGLARRGVLPRADLPRGCVIGLARLVDVVPTMIAFGLPQWSEDEAEFGDFSDGRFAWVLDDVVELVKPQPARGSLGLWKWMPSTVLNEV